MQLTKELFCAMLIFAAVWAFFSFNRERWSVVCNKFETFSHGAILTVSSIIMLVVEGLLVFYRTIPFVADEVYSLSGAAFFAGYNWSSYMSHHKFYNFGYTMIMAPLYRIFDDPVTIYRGMLLVNSLLHIITFILVYDICRRLNTSKLVGLGISVVATCNAITFFFKGFVYNEIPLMLIVWLSVWLLIVIEQSEGVKCGICSAFLGVFTAYSYIVHSRCLIIFVSLGVTVLLSLIIRRKWIVRPIWFAVPFAVCILLEKMLIGYVQTNLYLQGSDVEMGNSVEKVASHSSSFGLLLSFAGLKKTIMHFFSLAGAMTIETGGILTIITVVVLYYIIKNRKQLIKGSLPGEELTLGMFSFISLWGLVACIAVTGVQNERFRFLAYTRYFSPFIGPFILLGLFIMRYKKDLKWSVTALFSMLLTAIVCLVYLLYSMPVLKGKSISNNASLYFFYAFTRYAKQGKFSKSLFAIALGLLILFTAGLLFLYRRRQFMSICLAVFIFAGLLYWNVEQIKCVPSSEKRIQVVDATYDFFENDDEVRDKKVYCAGNWRYTKSALVTLYDVPMEYVFENNIADEDSVIISNSVDRMEVYDPAIVLKLDDNEYMGLWDEQYANKIISEFSSIYLVP